MQQHVNDFPVVGAEILNFVDKDFIVNALQPSQETPLAFSNKFVSKAAKFTSVCGTVGVYEPTNTSCPLVRSSIEIKAKDALSSELEW